MSRQVSGPPPTKALSLLPETLPNMMVRLGQRGEIRDLVLGRPDQLDQPAEQYVGRHISDLFPPAAAAIVVQTIAETLERQRLQMYSSRVLGQEGAPGAYNVWFAPLDGDNVMVVVHNDVRSMSDAEILELNRALISLQSAASAIALSLDLQHVLDTFVWELNHLLAADGCAVWRWVESRDLLECVSDYQLSDSDRFAPYHFLTLAGLPLLSQVVRERYARRLTLDTAADLPEGAMLEALQLPAAMLIPIVFQDATLGLVVVGRRTDQTRFSDRDLTFAQLLTNQAAAAMANARLYEETQRRLREQSALRAASARISSTLDHKTVLHFIAEQLCLSVAATAARISSIDEQSAETTILATFNATEPGPAPPLLEVMLAEGVLDQSRFLHGGQPTRWKINRGELTGHQVLGMPLFLAGRAVAFAELWDARRERTFDADDVALLHSIAQQGAVALEHARLHAQLEQNLRELRTLNRVSQAISSTLDFSATLSLIAENAQALLNAQSATIALVDEDAGELEFVSGSGNRSREIMGLRMSVNQGLMGWVARHGEPLLSNDVAADPRYFRRFDLENGFRTQSVVAVPLKSKGATIGVIAVIDHQQGSFGKEDLRRLNSLATPAAAAIENANLYARANQEIAERKIVEEQLAAERATLADRVEERTTELRLANEELAHAARLKDEFLANMSHELRTPLNAILGISEGLQEGAQGELAPSQRQSLALIERSGRGLQALIEDILDVAKIGSGRLTIEPGPVAVATLCDTSLQFVRQDARDKNIALEADCSDSPGTVFVDSRRVKQMLINLLSNAVKFTPPAGTVGLRVSADGDFIRFTVWDTGIGIAPDDLPHLFQPFVQLDGTLTRRYEGTGLGLHLVRKIAQLHNGRVDVQSTPGKGSSFTISLPRHSATSTVRSDDMMPHQPNAIPQTGVKTRVLIAEDDEVNRSVFSDFLALSGYDVIAAANGKEAIKQCRNAHPDVVLMDVNMPGMNGLDAIACIRQLPERADIPIIALTAMAMSSDRQACLDAGANEYLSKPAPLRTIRALIESLVASYRESEAGEA